MGCTTLPSLEGRSTTTALSEEESQATVLGRAIAPLVAANPGKSGVHPLQDGRDAFAARMLLVKAAQKTLDVQYYIWRPDATGIMMFEALHAAAERGVRVRLLLDDNNTTGLDQVLAALDAHPNMEVRLFNPFVLRKHRWLGYLTDFSRANRRMHNKSFTADNQITIVGGRNIGDEYFGASDDVLFVDLDVLVGGPIVREVSSDFDRYWSSDSAYPVASLLPGIDTAYLEQLAMDSAKVEVDPMAEAYTKSLRSSTLIQNLLQGKLELRWAVTRMVSDHPGKGLGLLTEDELLSHELTRVIDKAESEVALVSPYFVPTAVGVDALAAIAASGVGVKILTNALEATDVAVVHAGYAKRRKALLRAGIQLFEMQAMTQNAEPRLGGRGGGSGSGSGARSSRSAPSGSGGRFGSSASSLHAKTFAIDNKRVYVGSFNFDPRSAQLNTELGFIIESPEMARAIETAFEKQIPDVAYQVHLSEDGRLYWIEQVDGEARRHDIEPGTGFWQRMAVRLMSWLPIEWML